MVFSRDMLALQIEDSDITQSIRQKPTSVRKIARTATNEYELPLVIYNYGKSTLKDYILFITFSETWGKDVSASTALQLLNVETETATVGALYVDESTYQGLRDRDKIPSLSIIAAYEAIELTGHMVALNGSLGSGMYEVVALKLLIPESVSKVAIYYHIDSHGNISKAIQYGQCVELCEQYELESAETLAC